VGGRSLDRVLLKGGHEKQRKALEWADVDGRKSKGGTLVSERQDGPQFPLPPYTAMEIAGVLWCVT
jgi:hypothetical protein